MLEEVRDLFEASPKVVAVVKEEATKKQEEGKEQEEKEQEVQEEVVVPKALAGVSMILLEKIRAKEKEKKAKEMYQVGGCYLCFWHLPFSCSLLLQFLFVPGQGRRAANEETEEAANHRQDCQGDQVSDTLSYFWFSCS